ncbi:hypothetical protein, partial [Mesorhizobium sp. M7A.F.Ca.US.014.04.1.1]|uniref:hypothetical protein n=1 Tax=Mesorhizobium sp. M7A.F.Ca.US.014.04.1.1 TaxID=2496744 RepID=UPI0019D14835
KADWEGMAAGSIAADCSGSGADWHAGRASAAKASIRFRINFSTSFPTDISESPLIGRKFDSPPGRILETPDEP